MNHHQNIIKILHLINHKAWFLSNKMMNKSLFLQFNFVVVIVLIFESIDNEI